MKKKALLTPFFLDKQNSGYNVYLDEGFGMKINDGEVDETAAKIQQRVIPIYREISRFVAETAAAGEIPVAFNGDCVMTIPVLAGLQQAGIDPQLIWFDAHGDFNTWETTPSGFLGGMPLAMLVGLGEQSITAALGQKTLPAGDVILTDGRDLDPGERELVAASGIKHLGRVGDLLAQELPDRPLWVHFDVDVMRLDEVPAVSYPAEGGPSPQELGEVFEKLRKSGRLVCLSITLPNPDLDVDGGSRETVLNLVRGLLGANDR